MIDYEVLTENGFKDFSGIKKTIRYDNIKLCLSDGSSIIVTPEHKILVSKNIFRKAKNLKIGNKIKHLRVLDIQNDVDCSNEFFDLLDVCGGNHYVTNNVTSHNCAFIEKNIWDEFRNSVIPTISSGKHGRIIYTSTPQGMNHFYKIWIEARENKSGFHPRFVPYWEHPERDDEWAAQKRKELGSDIAFEQEFGCSFEGSSYTLINGKKFASIVAKDPIKTTLKNFKINIYEEPQEGHYYTIGVDTAKYGDGDFMSIQVIDITSKPFKQVAAFREKNMTYLNLVEPLYNIGTYYNCAHMFIENNSGDGQSSADLLMNNYDYENIYSEKIGVLGFRTTTKSRRIGLQNLKQLIEDDMLILNDEESIAELMRFALKNGKYQATDGYNDDSVMAIVASLYFLQLRNWVDVEDIHKFFSRTEYSEDEDDEPFIFGFMDDGSNNMIPF